MKFAVHTLGCKINQYETEQIIKQLKERGGDLVDFAPGADLYIVNSCYVTADSEKKSRQFLGQANRFRKENSLTVFTGCYAKKFSKENNHRHNPDLLIYQEDKDNLVEQLSQKLDLEKVEKKDNYLQVQHTRALLKVQDGCTSMCSYCTVPLARGKSASRPSSEIIKEAAGLIQAGTKELVITGINLGLYGRDLAGEGNLIELLEKIANLPGNFRLRLSSIEPFCLTSDFLNWLALQNKICRHIHVPLQSGSSQILNKMNRPYSAEEATGLLDLAIKSIPGLAVTTDIMVGFPGESQEDFEQTLKLINHIPFRKLHVFRYSPRPGTKAFQIEETVTAEEKKKRSKILLEENRRLEENFLEKRIGNIEKVLIEKEVKDSFYTGLSDAYIRFNFKANKCMISSLQKVKAIKRSGLQIIGKIID